MHCIYMYFLNILFPSFILLLISLNLQIIIFYNLKIRKSITVSLTKAPVISLVLSRIDYCSSILTNLPLFSISSLNRVIRSIILTTYNLRIREHSSTSSYQHLPPWFPFNKNALFIAYYLLFIPQCTI